MNAASVEPVTLPESTKSPKTETVQSPWMKPLPLPLPSGMNAASVDPVTFSESTNSPKTETVESPMLDETSPIASTIGMNAASLEPVTFAERTNEPKDRNCRKSCPTNFGWHILHCLCHRDECCIRPFGQHNKRTS